VARSTSGLDCGLGLNCFLLGITNSGEQGLKVGPMGLDLGLRVFFVSENRFFVSADISSRHQVAIFCIGL
jgi:hypothetical protein